MNDVCVDDEIQAAEAAGVSAAHDCQLRVHQHLDQLCAWWHQEISMDYTPILKLALPPFDDVPWDEAINGDMQILDAAVGQFFGVANVVGVWRNSIAYASGQSVVDAIDSSMWTCVVSHTSPAAPITFPQDRTNNPTRWVNIVASAHDYAQQAANSAQAANDAKVAAQAAQHAAEVAAAAVAGALPLSGGTMTGSITLAGDPTAVLHAATKQYVDARVGGTGYLPTTGGTLTGALTLASNPTVALHAATKQYVDTRTTSYLPLVGGTLSGVLGVGGTGIYYTNYSQGHSLAFGWNGSVVTMYVDGTYVGTPATGTYVPTSGGGFSGPISATSVATNAGGNYMFGDANYAGIAFDSWQLRYARATGTLGYYRGGDGAELFRIDAGGTGAFAGSLFANGNLAIGGTIGSSNVITGLDVNANRNMTAPGNIQAYGVHYSSSGYYAASDNSMVFAPFSTQRLLQYAASWYWAWNTSGGDLNWYTTGGARSRYARQMHGLLHCVVAWQVLVHTLIYLMQHPRPISK